MVQGDKAHKSARRVQWEQGKRRAASITEVTEVSCNMDPGCKCGGTGCNPTVCTKESMVFRAVEQGLAQRFHLNWGSYFMQPTQCRGFFLLGEKEDARCVIDGTFSLHKISDLEERDFLAAF